MIKQLKAAILCTVGAVAFAQLSTAGEHGDTAAQPIEAFFCDMKKGKDIEDLMQVAERFDAWADKHDQGYSAWILTPQFGQFHALPQVIWLGSSADGNTMGRGLESWLSKGQDVQEAFDKVVTCRSHSLSSSVEIHAPDGNPGDGVVMFSQCSLAKEGAQREAVKAHTAYSHAMRKLGAKNSNWLFFPMLGAPKLDFDYYAVSTFSSWSDYFAAYELFVNGGGREKAAEALGGVADCMETTPTVWDVHLVRHGTQ